MSVESLVEHYLTCLNAEGRTAYTLRWHRASLRQFVSWLRESEHPEDPEQWSASLLRSYIVYQRERPSARGGALSESALNSLIRSLRAFCNWLREDGWVERDLFAKVLVPKAPRLAKDTLTADDVRRLLDAVHQVRRNAVRDEAIVLFLLDTGCRANEVCTLRIDAIDWDQRIARVLGKGRKERYVPFSMPTAKVLRRYILRERKGTSNRCFESEDGLPLTTSGLYQLCKRLGRRAGVGIAPHKCRHTASIQYLRNGGSAFALQKLLGHSSLDTTLRYASLVTDDLIHEHEEHSPVMALISRSTKG